MFVTSLAALNVWDPCLNSHIGLLREFNHGSRTSASQKTLDAFREDKPRIFKGALKLAFYVEQIIFLHFYLIGENMLIVR